MTEKLFKAEKPYIPEWCNKKPKDQAAGIKVKTTKKADGAAEVSSMAARNVKA
jgi:hypothetical protein